MKVSVRVDGLREIEAALHELPKATGKNVVTRVLKKRGEPIANTARANAPVDQGQLRDSIGVSTKLSKRQKRIHRKEGPDDIEVFVGAGALPQAHMVEFGTDQMPAQPFMRPAWDKGKEAALEGIGQDLWAEIEKAATRMAKKAAKGR
jgi:HK97 gp10 family phage protein